MVSFLKFLAVVLVGIAAILFWQGYTDAVFVLGVGGAVAFFITVRIESGRRVADEKRKREERATDADAENE